MKVHIEIKGIFMNSSAPVKQHKIVVHINLDIMNARCLLRDMMIYAFRRFLVH